jgi:predicted transposase YbfD/YdcC
MKRRTLPRQPSQGILLKKVSKKERDRLLTVEVLLDCLMIIPDPRLQRSQLHPLSTILGLVFIATLAGADNPVEIVRFAEARFQFLKRYVTFPNGVPSHDTIGRVLALLEPDALETALAEWIEAARLKKHGRQIAIDGKTVRGAVPRGETKSPLHIVSAICTERCTVLGRVRTAAKSNEITAIPELLRTLRLRGAVVSIDAAGCQTEIATLIVDKGGDYIFTLKENQPSLLADAIAMCTGPGHAGRLVDAAETSEKSHGRTEVRRAQVFMDVGDLRRAHDFSGFKAVIRIESSRTVKGIESREDRYYITSVSDLDASSALAMVRAHWVVENKLHWILDVVFREDAARLQAENAVECLSRFRTLALEVLRNVPGRKMGISGMRQSAGWSEEILENCLLGREL